MTDITTTTTPPAVPVTYEQALHEWAAEWQRCPAEYIKDVRVSIVNGRRTDSSMDWTDQHPASIRVEVVLRNNKLRVWGTEDFAGFLEAIVGAANRYRAPSRRFPSENRTWHHPTEDRNGMVMEAAAYPLRCTEHGDRGEIRFTYLAHEAIERGTVYYSANVREPDQRYPLHYGGGVGWPGAVYPMCPVCEHPLHVPAYHGVWSAADTSLNAPPYPA